jgi:NADH-quinone oxidoreductase subunit N
MFAYSSISHAGYMLVGFVTGTAGTSTISGIDALLFYLVVYGAMTLGVFAVLGALGTPEKKFSTLDDVAGLSRTRPGLALVLMIFCYSLSGLPPTAGFSGKFNLFLAAWNAGTEAGQWLAIWLAVNAVIGAWYYLRVIREMYLSEPITEPAGVSHGPALVAMGVCTAATFGLFAVPNLLWALIQKV